MYFENNTVRRPMKNLHDVAIKRLGAGFPDFAQNPWVGKKTGRCRYKKLGAAGAGSDEHP